MAGRHRAPGRQCRPVPRPNAAGRGRSLPPGSCVQTLAEPPGTPRTHRLGTSLTHWVPEGTRTGVGMGHELPEEPRGLPASWASTLVS